MDYAAALAAADGRNGKQNLTHLVATDQLRQQLGGLDGNTIKFAAPELRVVIDEGRYSVGAGEAQGSSQLGSGGAGAVDHYLRAIQTGGLVSP